ncbi:hypothetical protein SAY87_024285 [Trapa incisa]|uniref:AP2/ERF domain-containing protein n=1 Tax=Trapa incisa TaxID=236973 RepID=A0AAN7GPF0_9MYRT|nr:hypothetical protein SAY87_024285 [Trapa incisa]
MSRSHHHRHQPPGDSAGLSPGGSSGNRHPNYRGVRIRSGKWVSEIREPRKTTRIWLGTYPTPEMAAVAYDVAALALKGIDANPNFPHLIPTYPVPASTSATDIRAAAAMAARGGEPKPEAENYAMEPGQGSTSGATAAVEQDQFVDEDAILDMPNLLVDMANGMLISPPRMRLSLSEDSSDNSDGGNLWGYP